MGFYAIDALIQTWADDLAMSICFWRVLGKSQLLFDETHLMYHLLAGIYLSFIRLKNCGPSLGICFPIICRYHRSNPICICTEHHIDRGSSYDNDCDSNIVTPSCIAENDLSHVPIIQKRRTMGRSIISQGNSTKQLNGC